MQFKELKTKALALKKLYADYNSQQGHKPWGLAEYTQGFVGDMGDLAKLVMAKNNLRSIPDADAKLAHELGDCLWSLIVIAESAGVNLETAFLDTMKELESRLA